MATGFVYCDSCTAVVRRTDDPNCPTCGFNPLRAIEKAEALRLINDPARHNAPGITAYK